MKSKVNWVKKELKKRGYTYDKKSKCGNYYRAKAFYNEGQRYLYFELIKCEICGEDYLKPKWSKAKAHRTCSLERLNNNKNMWE